MTPRNHENSRNKPGSTSPEVKGRAGFTPAMTTPTVSGSFAPRANSHYRGHQRCARIDYGNPLNAFAITICVSPRRPAFTSAPKFNAVITELTRIQSEGLLGIYVFCIMPDHVHLVANPSHKGLPHAIRMIKGRVSTWWRTNGDGRQLWQPGYFDHRIRSAEGFHEKCQYVLDNPMRAGLVNHYLDYPWSGILTHRNGELSNTEKIAGIKPALPCPKDLDDPASGRPAVKVGPALRRPLATTTNPGREQATNS